MKYVDCVFGAFVGVCASTLAFGILPDAVKDGRLFFLFAGAGAYLGAYGGHVLPPLFRR